MATIGLSKARWTAERRFFTGMALALAAAVFLGFAPSFYLKPWTPAAHDMEPYFYVHGAVFTAWYLLLIAQAALIGVGRPDLHRTLGKLSVIVAMLMVVMGLIGALIAARRPGGFIDIPMPPLEFLIVPFADMLIFSLLVGAAIYGRRDTQSHKRLMLIASISVLTAAIARFDAIAAIAGMISIFAVTDLFLLPLIIWDVTRRGRLHPATLWGGALLLVSQPVRLWLGGTAAWLAIARALTA